MIQYDSNNLKNQFTFKVTNNKLEKLREYITDYINGKSIVASDLYPIKEFIQHLKFQKLLDRYDDLYSMDMFGESIEGHKYRTPYQVVKMINPNSKEDMELLREVLKNNHFLAILGLFPDHSSVLLSGSVY